MTSDGEFLNKHQRLDPHSSTHRTREEAPATINSSQFPFRNQKSKIPEIYGLMYISQLQKREGNNLLVNHLVLLFSLSCLYFHPFSRNKYVLDCNTFFQHYLKQPVCTQDFIPIYGLKATDTRYCQKPQAHGYPSYCIHLPSFCCVMWVYLHP